ncbi:MAG: hypothetical protein Q7J29_04550 [Stagnimonas sp.]|nr:hypothetical protein [Stagnimonas sp.]
MTDSSPTERPAPDDLAATVLPCAALPSQALQALLQPLGLQIHAVAAETEIPGSYWGDSEAGLIGNGLYLRADTPVHSALHEACHWLLADATRRSTLHTNAGGTDTEENAVCYLQCLLAERLEGYSQTRCFADMDAWGYSFILGSAAAWFAHDSDDAQSLLRARGWLPPQP